MRNLKPYCPYNGAHGIPNGAWSRLWLFWVSLTERIIALPFIPPLNRSDYSGGLPGEELTNFLIKIIDKQTVLK